MTKLGSALTSSIRSLAIGAWACLAIILLMIAVTLPAGMLLGWLGIPLGIRRSLLVIGAGFAIAFMKPDTRDRFKSLLDRVVFPFGSFRATA